MEGASRSDLCGWKRTSSWIEIGLWPPCSASLVNTFLLTLGTRALVSDYIEQKIKSVFQNKIIPRVRKELKFNL